MKYTVVGLYEDSRESDSWVTAVEADDPSSAAATAVEELLEQFSDTDRDQWRSYLKVIAVFEGDHQDKYGGR